jgi:Na+/H+-translocating membrane pyrophosphatase
LVGGYGGVTAGLQNGYALASALISVLALGLFALFQNDQENDDDDSNPGGGLMQPVSGAA